MANVIYPADLWQRMRLPSVPEVVLTPDGFSEEQAHDFALAFGILKLLYKRDGTRRTVNGLNRAAQHQWPDEKLITSDFVGDIVDSWTRGEWQGIRDMIAEGKTNFGADLGDQYYYVRHRLISLAVVIASDVHEMEEAFVLAGYIVQRSEADAPWLFYRVAAQTHYGVYSFVVINHEVPQWGALEHYCRYHTKRTTPPCY